MEKLFVHSKSNFFANEDIVKKFVKENSLDSCSEHKFMFLSDFNKFKNKIPYFLIDMNFKHHKDVKIINKVVKLKKINKKDLSLVIFDSHTDMYQEGNKYFPIEKKVTMTNWVAYMLSKKYENISIVGVTDFTKSSPERKGFEYKSFGDKLSFFTGKDYNPEKDFGENQGQVELKTLEEFFKHPLKENTFISLDSDVSSDFTTMNPKFAGRLGSTTTRELQEMIKYIKNNSNLIGFSFYGTGWGEAFSEKSANLMTLLNE